MGAQLEQLRGDLRAQDRAQPFGADAELVSEQLESGRIHPREVFGFHAHPV